MAPHTVSTLPFVPCHPRLHHAYIIHMYHTTIQISSSCKLRHSGARATALAHLDRAGVDGTQQWDRPNPLKFIKHITCTHSITVASMNTQRLSSALVGHFTHFTCAHDPGPGARIQPPHVLPLYMNTILQSAVTVWQAWIPLQPHQLFTHVTDSQQVRTES